MEWNFFRLILIHIYFDLLRQKWNDFKNKNIQEFEYYYNKLSQVDKIWMKISAI